MHRVLAEQLLAAEDFLSFKAMYLGIFIEKSGGYGVISTRGDCAMVRGC